MANCTYCGQTAGILKKAHKECKQQHEQGKSEILVLVSDAGLKDTDLQQLQTQIEQIATACYINKNLLSDLITSGWEKAVEFVIAANQFTVEEERALDKLKHHFSLSEEKLNKNGIPAKLSAHKQNHGKSKISSLVSEAGSKGGDLQQLEDQIKQIQTECLIDEGTLRELVVSGWEKVVVDIFNDGIVTAQEENVLNELKQHFALAEEKLDRNGAYTQLVKGCVLRDILNRNLPERIKIDGILPFNLQKTEKLVWVFQNVDYYEEKTRTQYVGGSQGVGIRIAKGVYYRVGAFKGERQQTSEIAHADRGLMGVTNKHLYFVGATKRFRIAYNKIVAFEPFEGGIGVQRDAATAKPQSFVTNDDWFTYNLIVNLAQM